MSSSYGRLVAIRDYWMPRDEDARAEVRVTDLNEVLREIVRLTTLAADRLAIAEELRRNMVALEDEKNKYMDRVGDVLGQDDDESLLAAASRIAADLRFAECDSQRMGHLMRTHTFRYDPDAAGNHAWYTTGALIGRGPTLRDAIDAAMKEQKE